MAAKSKTPKKPIRNTSSKKPNRKASVSTTTVDGKRRLTEKQGPIKRYKSRRRAAKEQTVNRKRLPNAFKLFWASLLLINEHWRVFFSLTFIYGIASLVLVHGLNNGTDLNAIKTASDLNYHGNKVIGGLSVFNYLLGGNGTSGTNLAGIYRAILILVGSLAVVWILRQLYAGVRVSARDGLYKGMYPLIPVTVVLFFIFLQSVPLLAASTIYVNVINSGIAVNLWQKIAWAVACIVVALPSLYMFCSSLFALYIVTLPDMTPRRALRSAKELVRFRRLNVARKVLFLPLAMIVVAGLIMLPIIWFFTSAAEWIFFALSIFAIFYLHTYLYTLYREML